MELDDPFNPISARGQESCAEVQSVLLLAEAGARDNTDTGSVEETQAVELIGGTVLSLGSLNGLGWESDGGEEIHGTLYTSHV